MPTAGPSPAQIAALPPHAFAVFTTIASVQGLTTARMSARRSTVAARCGTAQAGAAKRGGRLDDLRFQNEYAIETTRTADRRLPFNQSAQAVPRTPRLRSGVVR
jgi:hypothetical protein